jgi:hypothetical protein
LFTQEEEKKKEKERQLEEERRKKEEEIKLKEEMDNKTINENSEKTLKENEKFNSTLDKGNDQIPMNVSEQSNNLSENNVENFVKNIEPEATVEKVKNLLKNGDIGSVSEVKAVEIDKTLTEGTNVKGKPEVDSGKSIEKSMDRGAENNNVIKRPKTPRSARTPRTLRPPTARKDKKESKSK